MKIIFLFCITTFLGYGANGLKCIWCTNPVSKDCDDRKVAECDSDEDYCVDIFYAELESIWKQCISKDAVNDCLNNVDGIHCTVCQTDGCNNLSKQDYIDAVEEAKVGDIVASVLKRKQTENES